ncbi:MAG: HAD hydrolase-like protein [Clostridiales bacterium]|jgi:phosphoglycolate phosphatase|nr:HAD hydrolase-like protein [Clostridiales bacterium]
MKLKYKAVFFDLDGTLFDTSEGIYNTFDYLFVKYGKNVERDIYPSFIGPPVRTSLARFFESGVVDGVHDEFRQYYGSVGKFQAKLYDGIPDALAFFKASGCRIYTATSKSEIMSVEITRKFGINGYFDRVYGADASVGRVEKEDVLQYALTDSGEDPKECLLIGDTIFDVRGAEHSGIACLAVTYGFGKKEEMTGNCVIGYAASPREVIDMFG